MGLWLIGFFLQSDNSAASLFRHLFSCFSRSFAAVSVTTHGNLPSCPAFPSDGSDLGFAFAGSDLQSDPIMCAQHGHLIC